MSAYKYNFLLLILLFVATPIFAQEDLESLLLNEMDEPVDYATSTFMSSHLLNSQSIEMVEQKGIGFRIAHKFGTFKSGPAHFYGFDDSNSLIELNYSPTDWWNFSAGRATLNEQVCVYNKVGLLRQSTGAKNMPISLVLVSHIELKTQQYDNEERNSNFSERLDYVTQVLVARKFNGRFSAQFMPTYIHRNLVDTKDEMNGLTALGLGAQYKILKGFRLTAEYYLVQEHNIPTTTFYNPLSLGASFQTSRHAFEVFVTNAHAVAESNYIAGTTNNFFKGDIRIGFNISTVFTLGKH